VKRSGRRDEAIPHTITDLGAEPTLRNTQHNPIAQISKSIRGEAFSLKEAFSLPRG
jgi:hypothetical protein